MRWRAVVGVLADASRFQVDGGWLRVQCLPLVSLMDPTLPVREKYQTEKRECPPHPFQGVISKGNGNSYTHNLKQKDLPTEHLFSPDLANKTEAFLTSLHGADCCVSVQNEPQKISCPSYLASQASSK